MQVIEQCRGNVLIYLLSGEISGVEAIMFSKAVESNRGSMCTRILINMQRVTFIDSEALGAFIYLNSILKKSGIQCILAGSEEQIVTLFRDCCLDGVFTLVEMKKCQDHEHE